MCCASMRHVMVSQNPIFTMLFTSAMLITGKNLANNRNAVKNKPKGEQVFTDVVHRRVEHGPA